MFKVGDKVKYVGNTLSKKYSVDGIGTIKEIRKGHDMIDVRFDRTGYTWWCHKGNLRILNNNKGDDIMRKQILVVGNTGNYATDAKKGDILNVVEERFGYVVTTPGKVKDIDYIEYKEGEMIAHINDLRDCFKAGLRFTDENNLVYPDGKIALKAENLQYLDRTFRVKRFKDKQFVIGNEKVELCFGYSEIGTIVEFRR